MITLARSHTHTHTHSPTPPSTSPKPVRPARSREKLVEPTPPPPEPEEPQEDLYVETNVFVEDRQLQDSDVCALAAALFSTFTHGPNQLCPKC